MLYKTNAAFCDARPRLHVITLKSTLDVGGSTSQCLEVERENTKSNTVYKKGSYNSMSLQDKQRCRTILNLVDKVIWSLRQV